MTDDSPIICTRLKEWLSEFEGIDAIEFTHTLPETLEAVGRHAPDMVIADLGLLSADGTNVIRSIKNGTTSPLLVILSDSPLSPAWYRERWIAAGADFFFDKSTEFQRIAEAIQTLVRTGVKAVPAHSHRT